MAARQCSLEEEVFAECKNFSEINEQFSLAFKRIEGNSGLTRLEKNQLSLHYIAKNVITVSNYFEDVTTRFCKFLPRILSIATIVGDDFNVEQHKIRCVLLGRVVEARKDLQRYALEYFEKNPSPFIDEKQQTSKRKKMSHGPTVYELELVQACYSLMKSDPIFYGKKWDWSQFIEKYLGHDDVEIKWIACHCISLAVHMSENQLKQLVLSKLPLETHEELSCIYNVQSRTAIKDANVGLDQQPVVIAKKKSAGGTVEISGVYIPALANPQPFKQNIVIVSSTYNNLKKIAFALSSSRAVCLQGPVGCGKTTLVEYVAHKTGRKFGENFVKVQLGDQTDSKMLLGTYRCTDVPGEFIWQPGVVTQAVIDGHWLLLEDIDSASVDIASVLSSLLENGSLTVPGYRDAVVVSPGFQVFCTQRLMSTATGLHKKHSNAMQLLEKHLRVINVDPLSSDELKTVLITLHPQFVTIQDRMLKVFQLFSTAEVHLPKTSRLISVRDFFKWCCRAAKDFDRSSQATALKVLQDAIDVFCCSYHKQIDALNLAREISTHLGIINQKAEYFFTSYKPLIQLTAGALEVGRASVARNNERFSLRQTYYFTRPSSVLLERLMLCVNLKEPVLLVGETGTGKTSTVQYLANTIGQKLVVINMNQQSDSVDLLGGFKPVDLKFVITPIRNEFEKVFCDFFQIEPNKTFLGHVAYCYNEQRWADLVKLMMKSYEAAILRLKKAPKEEMLRRWQSVGEKLYKLKVQLKQKSALAFAFIEGSLVKAVEEGYWVLLDEINLANAETLECLSGLLEGSQESLCLLERGDKQPVKRHPNFTLFACMNPSTDVGKRDLPPGLRNRFTEFFVDELTEKKDLILLVSSYLEALSLKSSELEKIVDFYLKVRRETETSLTDGLGHKPHFSLRSLCRALAITARNPCGMVKKSLYEAFCLSFLTQLDSQSYASVEKMISKYLVGDAKTMKAMTKQPIPPPKTKPGDYVSFEGYWIKKGKLDCVIPDEYILTESVRRNLKDLVRVVSIGGLPVLLQGDTSVGKTSLITYLAKSSGNKCVRINNHEHTDLQEYIGSYVADSTGKLVFREGVLVEAMRKGHWIILDELNLAPSDVLEAMNRVLDDNRELFIAETQETIKANPAFMLFATQNPPGSYGGRKMLSRAFRNRFVELHFNEIPANELETILHRRCQMAPSYAKKMISVMTELQMRRRGSAAFAGKKGFITLRDLFRWGERYRLARNAKKLYDWDQHLADEGYLVLAGKVRKTEEKHEIITVLQKHLKREVVPNNLFTLSDKTSVVTKDILERISRNEHLFKNIVWTFSMRQLAVLVAKAFQFKEPVLLVGETGGGKTTVCKLIAELNGQQLVSVNCHMHTESSDFIGGLRPVRDHTGDDANRLFEWVDGPLIQAMQKGDVFLADEISLADDSVLERLNSLLEPERTLLLAEKANDMNNSESSELIEADSRFHFIGTMNPGGDFGKKELSPALRNRFTEVWCESCTDRSDLIAIIERNIQSGISFGNQEDGSSGVGSKIMDFVYWFRKNEIGKRCTVSIRDILTWVSFINACAEKIGTTEAFRHGVHLTFLDGLGSGITGAENGRSLVQLKRECEEFVKRRLDADVPSIETGLAVNECDGFWGIKPFYISSGTHKSEAQDFTFAAPTTTYNTLRLLRGMQLNKAILLEGSPGVGKTSLVAAVAKCARHKIFRVNLSDQTDISDLFGADLPVEGGTGGQFSWRDGPLLQALRQGDWILLDELNLASQSVLEGLNACLDHRGEIFIPELGKTFRVKAGTRFFACQNPHKQGGSRRGLPQSFLNRFIQVHVSSLTEADLRLILCRQFSELEPELIAKMLKFNSQVQGELEEHRFGGKGAPWEFNLRDLTRWCEATIYHHKINSYGDKLYRPESSVQLIYGDRMRTMSDKSRMMEIFEEVFGMPFSGDCPVFYATGDKVYIGDASLDRSTCGVDVDVTTPEKNCLILRSQLATLRSLAFCVNLNWTSLLVGNSAAGKSAVVRVLANIAGKSLKTLPVTSAMDTTEILGGFEQSDYNRHLEELSKETEAILLKTVRHSLLKDRPSVHLLRLRENYADVSGEVQAKHTMNEDTKLFLRRLGELERILTVLCRSEDCSDKNRTQMLRKKLAEMQENVKNEGSLNAGGKFEWVDSVLIKCLQDGSWLLVDNVNLCSAAVLDRLNALLEPRGVLTVSERGVDSGGRMIEITPHPDFRLFLTMDPKNGEISRAMRNRGVEIYVAAENNSTLDVKSLISQKGLKKTRHIDSILCVHRFVSDMILGEKPNVSALLQASALIAQQIDHGVEDIEAFYDTAMEIYYKSRSSVEFCCNDFSTVIKNEIASILNSNPNEEIFYDHLTLQTDHFQFESTLQKIKQQAAYLKLQNAPEPPSDHIKFCLIHFYGIAGRSDVHLRHRVFESLFGSNFSQISNALYKFVAGFHTDFGEFPIDYRWIPDTAYSGRNRFVANRLTLGLHIVANLKQEQHQRVFDKKTLSLHEYLVGRKNNVDNLFDDVLIDELLDLLETYDKFLLDSLSDDLRLSDESVIKILNLITWRFFLCNSTKVNVKKISAIERHLILTNLKVHYRWFLKYSLNEVRALMNKTPPSELEGIVSRINESLEQQFSALHKIGQRFQKFYNRPLPRTSLPEIEFFGALQAAFMRCDDVKYDEELKGKLIALKLDDGDDFDDKLKQLKSIESGEISTTNYEIELLGFIDVMIKLKLKHSLVADSHQEFASCLTLPADLISSLRLYGASKDAKLLHELTRALFQYFSSEANLSPNLIRRLTATLVGDAATKFGNFRELQSQHKQMQLILWQNLQQLNHPDYDHLQNEHKLVRGSFEEFVKTLAASMTIDKKDLRATLDACLDQLSVLQSTTLLSDSFRNHLSSCAENYAKLNSAHFHRSLCVAFKMRMELGYAKAILNSRLALIDPSAKKILKKKYCTECITSFEQLAASFVKLNEIYSGNEKALHAHHPHVVDMVKVLKTKGESLKGHVAVRGDILYDEVVKLLNHGFSTILAPKYIDGIIGDLDKSIMDLINSKSAFGGDYSRILKQYEAAIPSFTNLTAEWSKYAASYPDVIEPLLSNLSEFVYGFKSSLWLLKKLLARQEFGVKAQRQLVNLVEFPNGKLESDLDGFFNKFLANEENVKFLKCRIRDSYNECVIEGSLFGRFDFARFAGYVEAFVQSWNEQEKRREREEKEADALYRTKSKCDDKTEDEQIEDELKEMFPNYHDRDFFDLRAHTLDDEVEETRENNFVGLISQDDVKFVVDLHTTLVRNFTKAEWLNPDRNKAAVCDFVHPLIEKYELFKSVCDKVLPCLDYRMDGELIASGAVLLAFVQNYGSTSGLVELSYPIKTTQTNRSDFYKDSNVEEVKSSFHILEELKSRIAELTSEWPDHPTLQTIATVIERIYGFDVTSPLSRFLTGFEILLSKCHEWEEVAHSGVSLSQISQNLTQQIIAWRKMELGVWKDLLNSTLRKMNDPTYKWWLYLYNVMKQFIQEELSQVDLIDALQKYVTKSNLAEFQTRLGLLHAFHCHAVHSKRTEKSDAFVNILWNVHSYFQQFAQVVAHKIKDLRAPIEKKLKDYVKIVRWKDVNYWAVKETVDKTHKTLHKFVREFRDALNQPVLPHLVNFTSNKTENVGIWDRPQRNLVKVYHYMSDPANYVAKESLRKKPDATAPRNFEKLQEKSDASFSEARKMCKDSISVMRYPKLIQSLDNLVGQIVETSTHLQGLEIDTSLPKSKQKSSAKSILHQKHRALSDLFKTLTKIGLSFRTGIVEAKLKAATDDFLIKPLDIFSSFSHLNYTRKAEKILTMWEGCELYYLRSLMRADVLDTALKTPAPDLGQQNIARCRGFSANLLALAHKHKSSLVESGNLFYYLRHYASQMSKLCEEKTFIWSETVERIQSVAKRLNVFMKQMLIFLNSCPEEDFGGTESCGIVLSASAFIKYKNDVLWENSKTSINDIISVTCKIGVELEKSQARIPQFERNTIQMKFVPADLSSIKAKIASLKTNIGSLTTIFGQIHITNTLSQFALELDGIQTALDGDRHETEDTESATEIENLTIMLTEKISQVIQTVSEKHQEPLNSSLEDCDDIQIEDEHLKALISQNLQADLADLCLNDILDLCEKLAAPLFNLTPPQLEKTKLLISCVTPLIEQLLLYHHYFLTQQVSAYRVVCKLNSVLLNIFIDLASKGFCIPPEWSDEMNDGPGKPSDGLGLGEGQGERDVSDRIESEDQLDDAQPAGQEKEKEDDPDCKEEGKGIEMSEDFDSKLQDVDQREDEDSDQDSSDSDADEQMGETGEGADKQGKENFESDGENENETEDSERKEERGDGEQEGESELGANDDSKSKQEDKPDDSPADKEKNKKEINEMEEPEYDDEQTDPYHGNQAELPEPEPMDLPDDLQLDEGQEKDDETNPNEENPFDVDAMKEDNPFDMKEKNEDEPNETEENSENLYSSEDEEITRDQDESNENEKREEEKSAKEKTEEDADNSASDNEDNTSEHPEESGLDHTHTNEDKVEAMEAENAEATDKTMPNQSQNQQSNQAIDELCQEDKPDKEGVGQSQMEESSSGHSAQTTASSDLQSSKRQRDEDAKQQQKPGESGSQRSLGNVNEPVKKKLKTMDTTDENGGDEDNKNEDQEADMYKHIREADESSTQVLDTATKEQADSQKQDPIGDDEENNDDVEMIEEKEDDDLEAVDVPAEKAEKTDSKKNKQSDKKQHPQGDILDEIEEVEVDGETIKTLGVVRGGETTYNTLYEELKNSAAIRLTQEEANCMRLQVEQQLSSWTEMPSDREADKAWQRITSVTASLAQDLSEQLRLVLEPTQASRLKGDFRTGRRINMRKVIPYIASQFRKDKIWLRRTKPSKREYQIVLAIDDSSSMADNHSKELAFESVALISKALHLLESGQLSVVSFGEDIEILHKLTDQLSDKSGVKLLQKFKFDQNKTCVAKLVNFVSELFEQSHLHSTALNAKLLVIVSDGRGVFSEGEGVVRQAVRRARLENIFMVFVIIDNPENNSSVLDIRMPSFKDGKLLGIKNYMDVFPFSFYIILRDINSLPNVLSDALRQWFEVVSNLDKQ